MRHIENISKTKVCTLCGLDKPNNIDYFGSKKSNKSGLSSHCKICINKRSVIKYHKNPEKFKAINKSYKERNRQSYLQSRKKSHEKLKDKERKYAKENSVKYRLALSKWRAKNPRGNREREYELNRYKQNPTKKIASASRYQKKYKEKKYAINHKRRAMLRGVEVHHTETEWIYMKEFYKNKCLRCYKSEPDIILTKDHVIPLSKGGNNSIENIQPLCSSCNSSKGNRHTKDYRLCDTSCL